MRAASTAMGLAVVLVVTGAGAAHAYLDAGSGSMMLQLLLGGLAGVGVACRLYWRRLVERFRGRPVTTPETEPLASGAEPDDRRP